MVKGPGLNLQLIAELIRDTAQKFYSVPVSPSLLTFKVKVIFLEISVHDGQALCCLVTSLVLTASLFTWSRLTKKRICSGQQILSLTSRPHLGRTSSSRKANRMSKNLFCFVKMVKKHGI